MVKHDSFGCKDMIYYFVGKRIMFTSHTKYIFIIFTYEFKVLVTILENIVTWN